MKHAICLSLLLAGACVMAPAQAQNAAGSTPDAAAGQWAVYKGDPQRTSSVDVSLGKPTLNLLWRHSTEFPPRVLDSTPLVIGPAGRQRIYFSLDRVVICVDGQTGQQLWRSKPLDAPISSPITIIPSDNGDLILTVTNRGQVTALRTSDGGFAWQEFIDPVRTISVINSAPFFVKTAVGDRIVLAAGTGRLVAFTTDGKLDPSWQVALGGQASAPTATAAVSRDGTLMYIPTQDKRVWVVNAATARVEYSITLRTASFYSPIVTDEYLLVSSGTSLNGLQLRTGREGWIFDVRSELAGPAAAKKADGSTVAYVGARNGRFYALNGATGAVLWSTDLADSVTGTPTVAEDIIFVGTRNGMLFGLAPDDGRVLWRYRLQTERVTTQTNTASSRFRRVRQPDPNAPIWEDTPTLTYGVSASPVVLSDKVFVLGDNSALYSFSNQPFDAEAPLLSKPQLSVLSNENKPILQSLDTEKRWLGPGRGPIEFTAEITDIGSGIDPTSIRVTFNRQELPASAIASFSDITGKLLVKLTNDREPATANLEDGNQTLLVTASDYSGNEMSHSVTFMVDNTAPAPRATPVRQNWRGNWP